MSDFLPNSLLASMQARQTNRLMKLHFPNNDGPESLLLIEQMTAKEELSKSFEYQLELLSDDAYIEMKELMGVMMTVELERADGTARYFNGYVTEAACTGSDGGYCVYQVTLSPWTDLLQRRIDNYIFHDQTLLDTIDELFADYRPYADYQTRVYGKVDAETFRVQGGMAGLHARHGESDFNYLHRRLEEKGWYYWYEHRKDGHTLVISDDSQSAAQPIDGNGKVRFHGDPVTLPEDTIQHWNNLRHLAPGKVAVASFDFKSPKAVRSQTDTRNDQGPVLQPEVYEYSGAYGFKDMDRGQDQADLRMEEIEAHAKRFDGHSNCRLLQPGRTFELSGHFIHDHEDAVMRQFLVREVGHIACNNYRMNGNAGPVYRNSFSVQRKIIAYRPGRGYNSLQPRLYGVQSAIVVGPPGEEIYCDEHGRVRVQFHWDRKGSYNEKSSCWVRVASTWAGSNFGAMAVPRIGQEVLVQWLDGNPDLPIITGRVYNQSNMPPWDLPANKTQSGILSRSTTGGGYGNANAIRFEDKKGSEQLWLHAEKDQLTEVEHDEDKWVGNDRRKTIDRDETNHIKRDRTETVDRDETITVHNNRTERVDHDETISIGDNRSEDVGKDETISIGQNRSETVGQNETIDIGQNRTETVGKNETISIGDNRTETVGQNESISIGANRSVEIGGSKSETVGKTKTETVAMAKMLSIGGAYQTTVGAAMNTTVGLMQAEQVGLSKSVMVGKSFSITAGDELSITVGKATLVMKSDGTISLKGSEINIEASGNVNIKGKEIHNN